MEALSLDIFIVPVIAVICVVLMYVHFSRRVGDKENYRYYILGVAMVAFVLNLTWELAQGPLYEGFEYNRQHITFCALASIADMLMVLVLFFGFGLIYGNVFWIERLTVNKVVALVVVGTIGAIAAEKWHTAKGDWAYTDAMPILPWAEVGIVPVLQFALLPLVIFLICKRFINENNSEI
ncbi:hypothetical protein LCGC14_1512360 [marine sediment metagenome]|uniref:Lycopene cyclase domain-containing protein n=2 Tax=root TaxID=1 RepID=A0A831VTA5_9FLAO|nr:hypothetical protein [Pricia antarctica]